VTPQPPKIATTRIATNPKMNNTPSRHAPSEQRSHVGPKETGGMAGAIRTPANANLGVDKPRVFDHEGAIGRQFSGTLP
jgi:hypothetical protein